MERVSVRDLKNQLSAYLRRVQTGTRVLVTDRGTPVAELSPVREEDVPPEEALKKMADAGEVVAPRGKGFSKFKPIEMEGPPLSQTILEEREPRR